MEPINEQKALRRIVVIEHENTLQLWTEWKRWTTLVGVVRD